MNKTKFSKNALKKHIKQTMLKKKSSLKRAQLTKAAVKQQLRQTLTNARAREQFIKQAALLKLAEDPSFWKAVLDFLSTDLGSIVGGATTGAIATPLLARLLLGRWNPWDILLGAGLGAPAGYGLKKLLGGGGPAAAASVGGEDLSKKVEKAIAEAVTNPPPVQ